MASPESISNDWATVRVMTVLSAMTILIGCVSTTVRQIDRLEAVGDEPRIVVITPDIKYYLLTAAGIPEPHAEWTTAARQNFAAALQGFAEERDTDLVMVVDQDELDEIEIEYQKLYSAVGNTVLINHFGVSKLPTKGDEFDWTLGPGVAVIGDKYDADYALFSFYRDYQASGGRIAFAILAAAAGLGVNTGSEGGFASLIDLKTGDIVWFNVVTAGSGELRNEKGAVTAVNMLFKDLPEG